MILLLLGPFGGCYSSVELTDESGLSFEAAKSMIEQPAASKIDWTQAPN